ncbi:nitrate ABC transporter permease [Desulfocarbo indianensis]|nr:nitrate ABC transporter permease [Desulfocarbo indianensis]
MAVKAYLVPFAFSGCLALAAWNGLSWLVGPRLVPTPWQTLGALGQIAGEWPSWRDMAITMFRGGSGLALATAAAVVTALPAGRSVRIMSLLSPVVAALQACPPILWISLLLVWAGQGNGVPLGVVFASIFPPLFANIAQGAASLDKRLLDMARVHGVGRLKTIRHIIWPGVYPYLLAGLSYALGACWKITAVAEFLGSSDGMGSRLYWSYRMLDLPRLFAWALILVIMGMLLELLVVRPLRGLQKG